MDDEAALRLVSLGRVDVHPADLTGDGLPWPALITAAVDDRIGAEHRARMPVDGWRELRPVCRGGPPRRVFAAPHVDGWAVAYLSRGEQGGWLLSADPGPLVARPGRATRRRHLTLRLSPDARARAGELASLRVTLTNTGGQQWRHDGQDSSYVHGWLLDDSDARLPSGWVSYAPLRHRLHDLHPGESVSLPVDFGGITVTVGRYPWHACLVDLDLWSPLATTIVD